MNSVLPSVFMRRLWVSVALLLAVPSSPALEQVPVTPDGGVYSVPVHLNGVLRLDLVLDTGAAFVMIPADVALTLKRTGTLTIAQEGNAQDFELADGSVVQQRRVVLCSLQIGSHRLRDVEAIVGGLKSPLLLGQSALRRLEPWRLDTRSGHLILREDSRYVSGPTSTETENACAAEDVAG
jgi:clan AA aspartic protease (TIGR02281 family)